MYTKHSMLLCIRTHITLFHLPTDMHAYTGQRRDGGGEGSPINAKQQLGVLVSAILPSQQLGSPTSRRKEIEPDLSQSVSIKPHQVS